MFLRLAVLAALACTLLTACIPVQHGTNPAHNTDTFGAPVGEAAVRSGGNLVMGLSAEPDRLDPTTSSSLYTRYVMSAICEKLYDLNAAGQIVPQLATALPTISPDGRTVTIPVRTGIEFADGTAFDANAVRTTLERDLTLPGSQRRSEIGPISGIVATDASHVVIHYKRPFAPITAALADRAGMIMSPTALAREGAKFSNDPVCVGPFKFVQRIPQTSITVARDPRYYDAKDVHLDTITYRIMTDANIRAANLRSGDIQVADTISTQDIDALAKDPNLTVLNSGSLGYISVTFNIANVNGIGEPTKQIDSPVAKDPRVRAAFAATVDRRTLVDTVFNNWYAPACSPIAPQTPYASPASNACPPFDPALSRRLLAQAGVPIPYPVSMEVTDNEDSLRFAQALQASVAEGGFDLKIVPVEYSTLLDMQDRGDFQLLLLGWSGRIDPDADISRFLTTGASGNVGGFSSPVLDNLLAQASRVTDDRKRAALYGQAVTVIQQQNPIVYLYRQRNLTVYSNQIAGVRVFADGIVRLANAAFVAKSEG
jgi:peptide/nickel transport system substrate-binding protein